MTLFFNQYSIEGHISTYNWDVKKGRTRQVGHSIQNVTFDLFYNIIMANENSKSSKSFAATTCLVWNLGIGTHCSKKEGKTSGKLLTPKFWNLIFYSLCRQFFGQHLHSIFLNH